MKHYNNTKKVRDEDFRNEFSLLINEVSLIAKTIFPMIFKKVFLYLTVFYFFAAYTVNAQNENWCIQDAEILVSTGETSITSCQGVGPNLVKFKTSELAQAFVFAVVDANNTILYVGHTSTIDLASFGAGALKVYAFSYQGQLLAEVGDDLFNTELAGYCYGLTTNFIPVQNIDPNGGVVSINTGETEMTVCVGDAVADVLQFVTTSDSPFYTYVITDNNDNILAFSTDGTVDFNNSPTGECHLWGAAFVGDILLEVGDHITGSDFASDCYELSDNYVTIHRENPAGGEITFEDGSTFVNACQGGNQNNGISMANTGNTNLNYAYILTDVNGVILNEITDDFLDFSSLPIGVSNIYGVSYSGDLVVPVGENVNVGSFSAQCFELSENSLGVERQELVAGEVSLANGDAQATICSESAADLDLTFMNTASGDEDFAYVITNEDGVILDYSTTDGFDFFGFSDGVYNVYGVVYTGVLNQTTGVNFVDFPFSNTCFGVTEAPVTIDIISVNGGAPMVDVDGEFVTSYVYCSTDVEEVVVANNSFVGTGIGIIVTDETGAILQVSANTSFIPETDDNHVYYIYSVAYTGNLDESINETTQPGVTPESGVFSDGCFAVSATSIELEVAYVYGGTLALDDGTTEAFICANDAVSGTRSYGTSSAASGNYAYILTDQDGLVFSVIDGTVANFSLLEIGSYRLYGASFRGNLLIEFGDDVQTSAIADGCFDLSENYLILEVTDVVGGQISTEDNMEEYFICPDTGSDESIVLDHANNEGTGYQYVVTDIAGVITEIIATDTVFVGGWDEGTYIVRGVSMTGAFTGLVGDNILAGGLSDGCFELSENSIVVNYSTPSIGNVTTLEGETALTFCVGDGSSDLVSFLLDDVSASKIAFLITDEDGFLIGAITDGEFDFENATGGSVRIYALSYTGNIGVFPGDNILDSDALSSDCWDLSDGYILVNKTRVDGGVVYTDFGTDTIYTCAGDGLADVITFNNSSFAPEADYAYVMTDINNTVLTVMDTDSLDFEATGFSSLRIWGISYTGTLDIGFGDNIETSVLSDGCYDLSQNSITVFQDMPEGGQIDYLGETEILVCVGHEDGQVAFTTSSTSIAGYVYLLLDLDGVILSVSEGAVDMTIVEPGMYRVWGLSYTGELLAAPGLLATQVDLASSCFEMSENFVLVEKGEDVDGGTIMDEVTGTTLIYTCPGDDIADFVVPVTTSSDTTYHYVIADENGIVTHPQVFGNVIDFDAAPPSIARIYGISLNGNSNIEVGTDLNSDELSDHCYTISDNYITVVPITPDAGMINSDQGINVSISITDVLSDSLSFSLMDATPHPYRYIVVNDGGEIVAIQEHNVFDFGLFSLGTYYVYGGAFAGTIQVSVGDDFDGAIFSDACFSITPNFITVSVVEGAVEDESTARKEQTVAAPEMSVNVFPNPASDYVNIAIQNREVESGTITLFNTMGAKVYEVDINNETEAIINTQNLIAGLYIVVVNVGDERQVIKLMKE